MPLTHDIGVRIPYPLPDDRTEVRSFCMSILRRRCSRAARPETTAFPARRGAVRTASRKGWRLTGESRQLGIASAGVRFGGGPLYGTLSDSLLRRTEERFRFCAGCCRKAEEQERGGGIFVRRFSSFGRNDVSLNHFIEPSAEPNSFGLCRGGKWTK